VTTSTWPHGYLFDLPSKLRTPSARPLTTLVDRLMARKAARRATPALMEPLEQRQLMYDAHDVTLDAYFGDEQLTPASVVLVGDIITAKASAILDMDATGHALAFIRHSPSEVEEHTERYSATNATLALNFSMAASAVAGFNTFLVEVDKRSLIDNIGAYESDPFHNDNKENYTFYAWNTDLTVTSIQLVDDLDQPVTNPAVGQTVYVQATFNWSEVSTNPSVDRLGRGVFSGSGFAAPEDFNYQLIGETDTATAKSGAYTIQAGKNTFSFQIDADDDIREVNASNNTASGTSTVVASALTVTSTQTLPSLITAPLDTIDITFSEPIDLNTLRWDSFTLARDGSENLLDFQKFPDITLVGGNTYRIGRLSDLNLHIGNYTLTLVQDGVSSSGTSPLGLSAPQSITWTLNAGMPSAPALAPDKGPYEAGYTANTSPTITGTAAPGAHVELYDQANNLLASVSVSASGQYSHTFNDLPLGNYYVKARAVEPGGYTSQDSQFGIFHVAANFVYALQITQFPAPLATPVTAIGVQFSNVLDLPNFNWLDLDIRLNHGDTNLATDGITIERTSPTSLWYRITLPPSITALAGDYSLTIKRAGVLTPDGKPIFYDVGTSWTRSGKQFTQITQFPNTVQSSITAIGFQSSIELDLATLDWNDIELTVNGGANLATSAITIDRTSPTSLWYRINIPSSLTALSGVYTLKLKGAGVQNANHSAMGNDLTTTWTRNFKLLQINQFPAPVTTPKTVVGFQSSVELDLDRLTWQDIQLSNDGVPIFADGITIERVSPTSLWYRINIPSALTTSSGTYTLTVKGAGISDIRRTPVDNDLTTTWTRSPHTLLQINQFPTPVTAPKTAVGFQSSVELDLDNLTYEDIDLSNDGVSINTSGITFERVSPTSLWYRINIPSALTTSSGSYTLKIRGADVLDIHGKPMGNDLQTSWTRSPRLFTQINQFPAPVAPSPTAIGFQSSVELDLSKFTLDDIELSNDGVPISTLGVTITRLSPTSLWYRVNLPAARTASSGTYTLKIKGAGVLDIYGKPIGNDLQTSWTRSPYLLTDINPKNFSTANPVTLITFESSIELDVSAVEGSNILTIMGFGTNLSTAGVTFERSSPTSLTYNVRIPFNSAANEGTFVLTILGSALLDIYGKPLGNNLQTSWFVHPS
jgi:hypothetical protein